MSVKFSVMFTGQHSMLNVEHMARRIEELGFDELHVADDLIYRPAWPMLALAAKATKHIKLGPFIVTPQVASPVFHASNLVALDELSGGRAIGGIGRGGFNPLVGLPTPKSSIKMLRESYEIVEHVIRGDRSGFNGEYFTASEEMYFQFDGPRKAIPMVIGTWGPKMSHMAGTIAAGIKADCVADAGYLSSLKQEMEAGAVSVGRDPSSLDLLVGPLCSISEDRDSAQRIVKEMLALLQPALAPQTGYHNIPNDEIEAAAAAFSAGEVDKAVDLVSDKSMNAFALAGTPEDVLPKIQSLIDAGATNIAFGPPLGFGPDFDKAIELIAERIVPNFR